MYLKTILAISAAAVQCARMSCQRVRHKIIVVMITSTVCALLNKRIVKKIAKEIVSISHPFIIQLSQYNIYKIFTALFM